MRIVIIVFVALILLSLGSALVYLIRDKGSSHRTVKALTIRVGLSIALFLFLMAGYYFGFLQVRQQTGAIQAGRNRRAAKLA